MPNYLLIWQTHQLTSSLPSSLPSLPPPFFPPSLPPFPPSLPDNSMTLPSRVLRHNSQPHGEQNQYHHTRRRTCSDNNAPSSHPPIIWRGREGEREGEGERKRGREGGREGGREEGRKEEREEGRERGRKRERTKNQCNTIEWINKEGKRNSLRLCIVHWWSDTHCLEHVHIWTII